MKILYLPLEFPNWYSAKKLTYSVGVGMCEGTNIDFTVVPAMYTNNIWLNYLPQITAGQEYDQVWFEVVHSDMDEKVLQFIKTLAKIRVGFVIESLTIHPDEFKNNQVGTQKRVDNVKKKLPFMTHAVVADQRDTNAFEGIKTHWGISSVPESVVKDINIESTNDLRFTFYGTVYGDRQDWVDRMGSKLIVNPQGDLENASGLPARYEELFRSSYMNMQNKQTIPIGDYGKFESEWRTLRSRMYSNWMDIVYQFPGCGVVNLPHRTQVLSSRVIESMAAGKVVFSPRMNNGADFLFKNGREILLYDSIEQLGDIMNELTTDKAYFIANNAREKVLADFTITKLIVRILEFTGIESEVVI